MSSDLSTAVESLDHPVDNAPVRTLVHKGLTIEGYSRAAVQTYWRVPELKLGFDLGGQPWSFMATPNWFVSHAHLDHLAALPVYVARRRMMKMEPPTIYLPAEAIEGVEMLLRAFQRLDRGRMPAKLVGLEPGQEVELSRELVVRRLRRPSTRSPRSGSSSGSGGGSSSPSITTSPASEIRDLRLSGVEVAAEIRIPKVAYLGDTAPQGLDASPEVYRAEILIMEMTFVAPDERPERIHKYGHTHLDDFLARADRFENEVIIASHFSTRMHPEQIQRIIEKRLPASLRGRLKIWL